jgi:hypothetical protein
MRADGPSQGRSEHDRREYERRRVEARKAASLLVRTLDDASAEVEPVTTAALAAMDACGRLWEAGARLSD